MVMAIYLRDIMRLMVLLTVAIGVALASYQWWVALHGDTPQYSISVRQSVCCAGPSIPPRCAMGSQNIGQVFLRNAG